MVLCVLTVPLTCLEVNQFFFSLLKQDIPQLQVTYCFLHRYALASKTLPSILKNIVDISVKAINSIRGLNHRLFMRCIKIIVVSIQFYFSIRRYASYHVEELKRAFFNCEKKSKLFLRNLTISMPKKCNQGIYSNTNLFE